MQKPALVILAAGIGSRYGGLKQIDPVGTNGELIIDYSIHDAVKAGFGKVIFIITHKIENDFKEVIGDRIHDHVEIAYAFQELEYLPEGFKVPEGRVKPWGTTHALICAKEQINGPFAVINADDYYGFSAYKTMYSWLASPRPHDGKLHSAMVGYRIENTLSENGTVKRGVCTADEDGFLISVTETENIEKTENGARHSEDGGKTWKNIPAGTLVSMNFWGFGKEFIERAEAHLPVFLKEAEDLKAEYLLPNEVDRQIKSGIADVKVLNSSDRWYGVTYRQDKPEVERALAEMHQKGIYPTPLWK